MTADAEAASPLDRAQSELGTSLAELRELARGVHPAVAAAPSGERAGARSG